MLIFTCGTVTGIACGLPLGVFLSYWMFPPVSILLSGIAIGGGRRRQDRRASHMLDSCHHGTSS
jgi:hypothetical protein